MRQNEDVIALYSRKSKFTGKGESIGNQVELGKEYVRVHFGDAAVDKIVVYEDEGFSGGNLNRPAFKRMMDAAKKRQFKAIIVYRLDRISRNVSDFSGLIEELARLDISFISIKEQFDTSTPMGRAMMYIASVFSQLERETIAERIRDNMHELAKTGRWLGGTTPTGFESEAIKSITVDGKTKKACKLKLVPEEADIVKTITFDMALVCRWFTGQAKISPKITQFYSRDGNREKLAADLENNVLLSMYDSSMAAQEVYRLLMQDDTISERVKKECSRHYPCDSREDEASFIADVLCFGMEREFIKRDPKVKNLLADGKLSPILSDFIADEGAPKPCRHFCGREKELEMLHELLLEHGKVFLHGIAGIGKSELAKAYAKQHRKEYTNVLYLTYTGNLMQDIADMDFADDLPDDSEQERFRKHNRFLRTLKEDTLFIVDNFNTTASQDSTLSVVMKYRCRMLFTTRSRFDNYDSMEVTEIAGKQALLSIAGCFFSDAEKYQSVLEQIIDTVHSHTLAVELAARLLETGILEPMDLLEKLKEEKTSLDADDKIGITKDGQSRKATYYDHIHTLFSLYQLAGDEQDIMRSMA